MHKWLWMILACVPAGLPVAASTTPKGDAAPLSIRVVETGFNQPLFMSHAPGDASRLFVVEKEGRIRVVQNEQTLPTPFLDVNTLISTGGERGLLGLAFHPDFAENGKFYIYYTRTDGDVVVAEYRVSENPNVADADSARVVIVIEHSSRNNHNGGALAFSPKDGFLYMGVGDGGGRNDPDENAQNLGVLLGKILRIDVDAISPGSGLEYGIPPGNPFVFVEGAQPEIWAYGVRNPWRFSFDRDTGDLYIGDVGQNAFEEVNFQPASSAGGENYGWDIAEGFACQGGSGTCGTNPGFTPPIIDYPHTFDDPSLSVTGGYVYRGTRIPGLQGTYFYADFVTGQVWSLRNSGGTVSEQQERTAELEGGQPLLSNIASFGEDAQGELYIVEYASGILYKIYTEYGDVDNDGEIDAVDVQIVINGALGLDTGGADPDINGDGQVNAEDVQLVVNAALGLF